MRRIYKSEWCPGAHSITTNKRKQNKREEKRHVRRKVQRREAGWTEPSVLAKRQREEQGKTSRVEKVDLLQRRQLCRK